MIIYQTQFAWLSWLLLWRVACRKRLIIVSYYSRFPVGQPFFICIWTPVPFVSLWQTAFILKKQRITAEDKSWNIIVVVVEKKTTYKSYKHGVFVSCPSWILNSKFVWRKSLMTHQTHHVLSCYIFIINNSQLTLWGNIYLMSILVNVLLLQK